jgi:hypothetical protein
MKLKAEKKQFLLILKEQTLMSNQSSQVSPEKDRLV